MAGEQTPRSFAVVRAPHLTLSSGSPANVTAAIATRISQWPHGKVITYGNHGNDRAMSYLKLWQRSGRIASGLRRLGVRRGAQLVLLIEDAVDFVPAFWACLRLGLTAVPLMSVAHEEFHRSQPGAFREALRRLNDVTILADEKFAEFGASLRREYQLPAVSLAAAEAESSDTVEDALPADPPLIVPTSGSTGQIKLVALGEEAILNRHFADQMKTEQHYLGTFPLDSATGQAGAFLRWGSWTQIPATVLTAKRTAVLDAIEQYRITAVSLTSSAANAIVTAAEQSDRRWRLGSLRQLGLGAETVVPDVVRRLIRFVVAHGASGDIVQTGYGSTETGLLAGGEYALPTDHLDAVCLGGCARGVELRIVNNDGAVVAERETGEVQALCGPAIFSCYWGDPEATKASFAADGWWRTGDVGRLQGGKLSLHGRAKEVLNISGRKFSLAAIDAEIETVLGAGDRAFCCAVHWPGEATERLAVAIVPANHKAEDESALAQKVCRAVGRTLGIRPSPVLATTLDHIPFGPAGKLRRMELSAQIRLGVLGAAPQSEADEPAAALDKRHEHGDLEAKVAQIWRDTMNLCGELDSNADFFDLGGDSLRSLLLHVAIELQFGKQISADAFFAKPTLATLSQLVAQGLASVDKGSKPKMPWPLPGEMRNELLFSLEAWDGIRPTRDRLVAGLNTTGSKTPLFWVFQNNLPFRQLADCLGAAQPVYAFRSGQALIKYSEDEIQAFALRYASEVAEVSPDGPVFIGGCCQGALIALALAQHLIRRGRHIPLLILYDWGFSLQAYPGPLLFMYGSESPQDNPYSQYRNPDLVRERLFADYTVVEMPGDHGSYYEASFKEILPMHMQKAEGRLPTRLPRSAHRALLNAVDVPDQMIAGERRTIQVVIENLSTLSWPAAETSNLYLANRWLEEGVRVITSVDGRVPLPELRPLVPTTLSLPITAPPVVGDLRLTIDVVEEGNTWFCLPQKTPLPARIKIVSKKPPTIVEELLAELEQLQKTAAEQQAALRGHYEASTSWKATRPLREAKMLARSFRNLLMR